jgi:23S rRNA U2552 (ribose-2'-O)-methylase RlmE/FtsJ
MIEIIDLFHIENITRPIKSFHLSKIPEGFVEALIYKRKNVDDKYYRMSSLDDLDDMIHVSGKKISVLNEHQKIYMETGADKTGNLLSIDNLIYCKEKYGSSMDIITSDVGTQFSIDFTTESDICRILFAQICFALCMQSLNGSFILQIFDCFTEATIDMIAILSSFYKKVYITKPNTSRLSSSEKYIVCKGFLYHDASMWYPYILKSFMEMMSIPPNIYIHRFLSGGTIPYYFITKIEDYNAIFGQQQIEHIHYTISIMDIKLCSCDNFTSSNSKNMTVCNSDTLIKSEKIESIITENVKKCVYWCIKHNIPYNISFAQI